LRVTGCKGTVHATRLEGKIDPKHPAVDVVTARALASLHELLSLAYPFMNSGAQALFHKGQDIVRELTEAEKYWRIQYAQHDSLTDSQGIILRVTEVSRV